MVALALIDAVLTDSQQRSTSVAAELVTLALRDLESIEQFDQRLLPEEPERFDRPAVALLLSMYENWAGQTEALLERLGRLEHQMGLRIAGREALQDARGRIRAFLSVPIDEMEQARKELAEGKLVPFEEVRRELRLGVH